MLVSKDEEERHRRTGEPATPAATVYTVRHERTGQRRHFTVGPDGTVTECASYEQGFGPMLLEPDPERTIEVGGKRVHPHRYSLYWAGYDVYRPRSAEALASLRASRERAKQERAERKWAEENTLLAWREEEGTREEGPGDAEAGPAALDRAEAQRYGSSMRWPDVLRLQERIRRERPELTVDSYPSGTDHYALRLYCMKKTPEGHELAQGSVDTIYGVDGWKKYLEEHPQPFCSPEESYHTNALGKEVDFRGNPVTKEPPPALPLGAEEMLEMIVALGRATPGWWKDPTKVAELAAAWGARTKAHGEIADYEVEQVARLASDVHASVLIARTGSGLFATGIAARWGEGGIVHEPSVGSVPYDTEPEARRAAYKELIETLQAARQAAGRQQRALLLEAVKEKDRERGLFG